MSAISIKKTKQRVYQLVLRSANKVSGTNTDAQLYIPHVFQSIDAFECQCAEIVYCGESADAPTANVFEWQISNGSMHQADTGSCGSGGLGRIGAAVITTSGTVSRPKPASMIIPNPANKTLTVQVRSATDGRTKPTLAAGADIRDWTIVLNLYPIIA